MRAAAARDSGVGGTSSDSGGACCADGGEVVESDRKTHGLSRQTAQLSVGFSPVELRITKPMLGHPPTARPDQPHGCVLTFVGRNERGIGPNSPRPPLPKAGRKKRTNRGIQEKSKLAKKLHYVQTCGTPRFHCLGGARPNAHACLPSAPTSPSLLMWSVTSPKCRPGLRPALTPRCTRWSWSSTSPCVRQKVAGQAR